MDTARSTLPLFETRATAAAGLLRPAAITTIAIAAYRGGREPLNNLDLV